MLGVLALALLGCALGLLAQPPEGVQGGHGDQLLDLVRVVTTVALALSLLLGPGIAWRALAGPERRIGLAFLPLPGLAILAAAGALAWALGGSVDPRTICFALTLPVLALVLGTLASTGPDQIFDPEEQRCLLVVGCVLGLAVARALWSLGPEGELYGGTVSHTLEVGDRSDSRISFIIPQLVANHEGPYGRLAALLFAPYNFSSRGPVPGLAATPLVLVTGGHPPAAQPEQAWAPFDHQGFEAYRLTMIVFACLAFTSLWDLTRRLAGAGAARLALVLAATTPFLVHETWFTWPKMLAASMVLAAAICVISRRPLAGGLLMGGGYLMHPVALLSLPAIGLIALWPLRGARWNRPQVGQLLRLAAGVAFAVLVWRLVNGSHYSQSGFLEYFTEAGSNIHPDLGAWAVFRAKSLADTVVPLLLPLAESDNPSINVVGGRSPAVVHFFFQYWNTLPFGVAIVFFPLLLASLWRSVRRWPWAVFVVVLMPFALFTIYWGSSSSGMMREGLQAWTLTLMAVVACEQAARRFPWLRSRPVRVLLALRTVEVLAVALVPTLATRRELFGDQFVLSDAVAVAAMLAFAAALAWQVRSMWKAPAPGSRRG